MTLNYVVSADSHIFEPLDLWEKALGTKWGDKVPRLVSECEGVSGNYFYLGHEYIDLDNVEPEEAADSTEDTVPLDPDLLDKVNRCSSDPGLRLELMDLDGVSAELINSSFLLFGMRIAHPPLLQDVCTVYNDWIAEYCGHAPKRLLAAAMLPTDDVDWAVAEMQRLARKGIRTVCIYTDVKPHMPPYRDRYYDPLWAASVDLDMPITLHIVTGQVRDPFTIVHDHERDQIARMMIEVFSDVGPILANEFIFGGVFDRFPKLKVILGEYEISWVPWFLFRIQQIQGSLGQSLKIAPIEKPVEEYLQSQVWHGFVDDKYADRAFDVAGPTQVMWGSDFPHVRNTFPNTHRILERVLANVDDETKANVVGLNCARLFNLDVPASARAAAE